VVPSEAAEGRVRWCGWHGMQGGQGLTRPPWSSTGDEVHHVVTCVTSCLSALSCGVEVVELDAGVLGGEPPVDTTTSPVAGRLPRRDLPLQGRLVGQAAGQALAGQHGQRNASANTREGV
jgi:hypothetical protein